MADQNDPKLLEQALRDFRAFISSFDSVVMATTNEQHEPEASYAPVLELDGKFYIYVSELAVHTRNLLANKTASLLFIEDESHSNNVFARQRATIQIHAEEIERESQHGLSMLDKLERKFPKMMPLLRSLNDFHLLLLTPQTGSYTAGFGRAYQLSGEGLGEIRHISRR